MRPPSGHGRLLYCVYWEVGWRNNEVVILTESRKAGFHCMLWIQTSFPIVFIISKKKSHFAFALSTWDKSMESLIATQSCLFWKSTYESYSIILSSFAIQAIDHSFSWAHRPVKKKHLGFWKNTRKASVRVKHFDLQDFRISRVFSLSAQNCRFCAVILLNKTAYILLNLILNLNLIQRW